MTSNQKSQFYLEIIKRSHEAFREYLTHLPEDILAWKVHDSMYTSGWIIEHLIHDQIWIVNVVLDNHEEGYHFEDKPEGLTLDDLIEGYDEMVSKVEQELANINDNQLNEMRTYKEYSITVEDWLFEYIHHLNQHGGELGFILTAWKRKNRSLVEE
ncbi:MAG: DinB family protein [Candidatus Heimdallarchaeaceae archaeon]